MHGTSRDVPNPQSEVEVEGYLHIRTGPSQGPIDHGEHLRHLDDMDLETALRRLHGEDPLADD
jgi:hypothetical protein